jgi:hypothetical protein
MAADGNGAKSVTVQAHRIVITFIVETGEFNVNGPMDNGCLFLVMLEMAKLAFLEERLKGQKQILVARPSLRI